MRAVLILVMVGALFAGVLTVALLFMRIPVEGLALVCWGLAATATSLLSIGEALVPSWAGGRWGPGQRKLPRPPNRLTSFGFGVVSGTCGAAFLGAGWLTEHIVPVILGGFATGFVLSFAGLRYAQRQGEAARAIQVALLEYSDRHDGWFPRGEASSEAALSLLHRENPSLVTADVLSEEIKGDMHVY